MLLGQAANFILQAGCFILLARLLGVTQYGVFAGAIALVNIITPYSSLGSPVIFIRYVTANRSKAGVYWGNILLVTAVGSILIACIYLYLGQL
jgi:O-antigen/teichoic acid export membrane protein